MLYFLTYNIHWNILYVSFLKEECRKKIFAVMAAQSRDRGYSSAGSLSLSCLNKTETLAAAERLVSLGGSMILNRESFQGCKAGRERTEAVRRQKTCLKKGKA